ncbi:hypothetical protein WICPIJ_001313 [Wickerhamomyces pijperi]|uniref:Uncharacterized protein n=1 Tax=Wickerhamomyces pijperi TaxID=599730 RepID=A0A9P8QDJ1_WICPI|nr:hypothetical protein WICPIJ_001313 [Wickerhamomyces pijperi]
MESTPFASIDANIEDEPSRNSDTNTTKDTWDQPFEQEEQKEELKSHHTHKHKHTDTDENHHESHSENEQTSNSDPNMTNIDEQNPITSINHHQHHHHINGPVGNVFKKIYHGIACAWESIWVLED